VEWDGSSGGLAAGKCKVEWTVVCAPKLRGGQGFPNLEFTGFALRLRWEWLKRTRPDAVWSMLPSIQEKPVVAMFEASTTVVLGDGHSTRFWTDCWLSEGAISTFVRQGRRWVCDISGALSAAVLCDYVLLWERLEQVALHSPRQPTSSSGVGPTTVYTPRRLPIGPSLKARRSCLGQRKYGAHRHHQRLSFLLACPPWTLMDSGET